MKYLKIHLIFLSMYVFACSNNANTTLETKDLIGTKWSIRIAEDCVSKLEFFKQKKILIYNCEMNDTLYGTYNVNENYLILIQEGSLDDTLYSEGSIHKIGKARFKLTLKDGKLFYLTRENFVNDEWIKSKHSFQDNYYLEKIETQKE